MCQLLGMNCVTPTDITFSFTGFAARGGMTAEHADGFGIAFFEDKACRLFIDHQSSCSSPVADLIKRYPIKSKNVIAHIRKATQGAISLENTHPFMRELWGRHWIFAHNGDLKNLAARPDGVYHPVGTTDSEIAFCQILHGLRVRFPGAEPPLDELFAALAELVGPLSQQGIFNFLLSNGQALFAHCSTNLHYIIRQWPFSVARLLDTEVEIDFSQTNVERDRVSVIATLPLTSNENWTQLQPGQLLMFVDGVPVRETQLAPPPAAATAAPGASGALLAAG